MKFSYNRKPYTLRNRPGFAPRLTFKEFTIFNWPPAKELIIESLKEYTEFLPAVHPDPNLESVSIIFFSIEDNLELYLCPFEGCSQSHENSQPQGRDSFKAHAQAHLNGMNKKVKAMLVRTKVETWMRKTLKSRAGEIAVKRALKNAYQN